jgi:DNA-binding NarL/FixJ family response regulator
MSESTVKVHIAAIFRALEVSNRTEAVLAIQRLSHPL